MIGNLQVIIGGSTAGLLVIVILTYLLRRSLKNKRMLAEQTVHTDQDLEIVALRPAFMPRQRHTELLREAQKLESEMDLDDVCIFNAPTAVHNTDEMIRPTAMAGLRFKVVNIPHSDLVLEPVFNAVSDEAITRSGMLKAEYQVCEAFFYG